MDKSNQSGPQYPAKGSKITGDPALGVSGPGTEGGHATAPLLGSVVHQAESGSNVIGGSQDCLSGSLESLAIRESTSMDVDRPKGQQQVCDSAAGGMPSAPRATVNEYGYPVSRRGRGQRSGRRVRGGRQPAPDDRDRSTGSGRGNPANKRKAGTPGNKDKRARQDTRLQVAFVDAADRNRPLGPEEATNIREHLVERIIGDTFPSGCQPQCANSGLMNDAFIVTCDNQSTYDWLMGKEVKLESGATYKPYKAGEHRTTVRFKVRVVGKVRTGQQILDLLGKQNPGLTTAKWRVLSESDGASGTSSTSWKFLKLEVDEESASELDKLELRPYYELSRVLFERAQP